MNRTMGTASDRRESHRFTVNAPVTINAGAHKIPAYTRDLSNRGVYFLLTSSDSLLIDGDFEFLVELPPEITLSTSCAILCIGRMVRKENTANDFTGMAAEILHYSILKGATLAN